MVWSFCDLLMIYYLHTRFGLSGDALILVTVPALLLSGVLDVALGQALRRISPRQILTLQATGAVTTGFGAVILFAIVPGYTVALLLAMAGFRLAYTLYDVTQNALTSLLPASEADARRYITLRVMLSSAARLLMASVAMALIGNTAPLAGWEAIVLLPAAVLAIVSGMAMTRVSVPADVTARALSLTVTTPRGIAPLLAAAFFHAAALSMPARFIPFMVDGQTLLFIFVAGTLVGPIVANALTAGLRRKRGIIVMAMLTVIGLGGLAMPAHPPLRAVGLAIHGIGVGGTGMLLWHDMSRIVRDHACRTGERADLLAFALLTSAIKIGIAACAATMAWVVNAESGAHAQTVVAGIALAGGLAYILAMRLGASAAYQAQRMLSA